MQPILTESIDKDDHKCDNIDEHIYNHGDMIRIKNICSHELDDRTTITYDIYDDKVHMINKDRLIYGLDDCDRRQALVIYESGLFDINLSHFINDSVLDDTDLYKRFHEARMLKPNTTMSIIYESIIQAISSERGSQLPNNPEWLKDLTDLGIHDDIIYTEFLKICDISEKNQEEFVYSDIIIKFIKNIFLSLRHIGTSQNYIAFKKSLYNYISKNT